MKILVLGGTGAMGVHLVQILADAGHDVYVTTKYSLQGTTQGNGLTGGLPPVRFSM